MLLSIASFLKAESMDHRFVFAFDKKNKETISLFFGKDISLEKSTGPMCLWFAEDFLIFVQLRDAFFLVV